MRRITLLCLISTFLFAAFEVSAAQNVDSLLFEAARRERIVFEAQSPVEVNEALIEKADLYKQAGLYSEALKTLERVRLYLVKSDLRSEIIIQKSLCAYLDGDYDASISYLEELGVQTEYVEPKLKKDWVGMALTFLVPAGYIYAGAPGEGAVSTALNAGSVAWVVLNLSSGLPVTALLGGALALSYTFLGSQERVAELIAIHNSSKISDAKRDAASKALLGLL
ncbi:MAG: hypothetical protein K5909_06185 [Bacteroidales bacterium]|nr:hypothetical protein [Bacteroidales bacterium]